MTLRSALYASVLLATPLFLAAPSASAAPSYDACTGFITTVPTTISTQGVWCFNGDLATGVASGAAITINANNITIDCNGFKLGGLSAGMATATKGVYANGRSNATIRDCNIRGFATGIVLEGSSGGGHRVERNRLEGNTAGGALVIGDGSLVRDNLVVDTGGTTNASLPPWMAAIAVQGAVDVVDNRITGVDGAQALSGQAIGILVGTPNGVVIEGNTVSSLVIPEEGMAIGVGMLSSGPVDVRNNSFFNEIPGYSVACSEGGQYLYANALMMGEPSMYCLDGGDNYGLSEVVL